LLFFLVVRQWENWLNINGLTDILSNPNFYCDLFYTFPHIFGKYPPADLDGLNLVNLILENLKNLEFKSAYLNIQNFKHK